MHTDENIKLVRDIIEEDPHATYDIIQAQTQLSRWAIQEILHNSLKLRKITSRWVPHELTDEEKQKRVKICRENLAMFEEDKWRLCDIVTGDDAGFFGEILVTSHRMPAGSAFDESPRTVVRRHKFEPKTMFTIFFKASGPVFMDRMNKGEHITSTYYIKMF